MDAGARMLCGDDAGKTPLAAAGIKDSLAKKIAERFQNDADVQDSWIDRRREVFFVAGRLLKGTADPLLQIRR